MRKGQLRSFWCDCTAERAMSGSVANCCIVCSATTCQAAAPVLLQVQGTLCAVVNAELLLTSTIYYFCCRQYGICLFVRVRSQSSRRRAGSLRYARC